MSSDQFNPFMDEDDDVEDKRISELSAYTPREPDERYAQGQAGIQGLEDEMDLSSLPAPTMATHEQPPFTEPEPQEVERVTLEDNFTPPTNSFDVLEEDLTPTFDEPASAPLEDDASPTGSPFSMGNVGIGDRSADDFVASIQEDNDTGGEKGKKGRRKRGKGKQYDGVSEDYRFENTGRAADVKPELTRREKLVKIAKLPLLPLILLATPFRLILRPIIKGDRTRSVVSAILAVAFILGLVSIYGAYRVPGDTVSVSESGQQVTVLDSSLSGGVAKATLVNQSNEEVRGAPGFQIYGRKLGLNPVPLLLPGVVGTCRSEPITMKAGATVEVQATCDANIPGLLKTAVGDFKWM